MTISSRFLRAVLVALALAVLPGCSMLYLAQAARGQWQLMHARRPIESVIADESTPDGLRDRLIEVRAAREFASRELGLPDNGSYRTYAAIERPYVVWNVVAAPEFSVEPKRWCFLIVGCVSYRGYFSEQQAKRFAARLQAQGFDVFVGGVPAYSTLGRFADPVVSTMLVYGDTQLAAIIFHELAHQVVYAPGDTEFNEAFAVTVEQAGLEKWLKARGHEADMRKYQARRSRHRQFVALFTRTRSRLAELYEQDLPPEVMRGRKEILLAGLAGDILDLEARLHVHTAYEEWIDQGLNNAHLASVATYFECVPGFERLLGLQDGDLRAFYAAVRELARLPRAERHEQLCTGESREVSGSAD